MGRQIFEVPDGAEHAFVIIKMKDEMMFASILETGVLHAIPMLWQCYFKLIETLPQESKLAEGFREIISKLIPDDTVNEVNEANRALVQVVEDLLKNE